MAKRPVHGYTGKKDKDGTREYIPGPNHGTVSSQYWVEMEANRKDTCVLPRHYRDSR